MDRDTKRFEAALRFALLPEGEPGSGEPLTPRESVEHADALLAELEKPAKDAGPQNPDDGRVMKLESKLAKALALGWADSEWEPVKRDELASLREAKRALETLGGLRYGFTRYTDGRVAAWVGDKYIIVDSILELAAAIQREGGE